MTVTILQGDNRAVMRELPEKSVHAIVTSPPFFNLRSYLPEDHPSKSLEIGIETTPTAFVSTLVDVFHEARRVLRDDGTLWLQLGDSYAAGGRGGGGHFMAERGDKSWKGKGAISGLRSPPAGLKPKDLIGIPWRVALALQADGWWLRADIVWNKPNCQPSSVTDRPTTAHEYIFLLAKREEYFYDDYAVLEPRSESRVRSTKGLKRQAMVRGDGAPSTITTCDAEQRGMRSVWNIATKPLREDFYAAFPEELAKRAILAGTSEHGCCSACGAPWTRVVERSRLRDGVPCDDIPAARNTDKHTVDRAQGIGHNRILTTRRSVGWKPGCECAADRTPSVVLDPFGGSGTVGRVANELGRHATLIELNPASVKIAERRCAQTSLFAQAPEAAE